MSIRRPVVAGQFYAAGDQCAIDARGCIHAMEIKADLPKPDPLATYRRLQSYQPPPPPERTWGDWAKDRAINAIPGKPLYDIGSWLVRSTAPYKFYKWRQESLKPPVDPTGPVTPEQIMIRRGKPEAWIRGLVSQEQTKRHERLQSEGKWPKDEGVKGENWK